LDPIKQAGGGVRSTSEHLSTIVDLDHVFPTTTSTRLSAVVRLVACFAAVHIVFQHYSMGQRPLVPLAPLFLFTVYVGVLYWQTVRNSAAQERQVIYWLDTLWYLVFAGMTGGPRSDFSFFLPFPVLFISLRWGFVPGMTMAACSTGVLLIIGALSAGMGMRVLDADILLPPATLLVLGYLIATSANSGLALNRRLASLKEINSLFNPRLNIEQIIDLAVRHLAKLYRVDKYALVLVEAGSPPRAFRANLPDQMYQVSDTAAVEITNALSGLDAKGAVIYRGSQGLRQPEVHCLTTPNAATSKEQLTDAIAVANRLDCAGFGSVQFSLRQGGTARLIVCSDRRSFGPADLPFFRQLGEQLSPRIENVQLLDRLAREVAEHERQKISRDIHDSAIQPYIGLKFALEALARKVPSKDPLSEDIGRLVEMANIEIAEMRRYVKGLRGHGEPGHAALVPAVRRQAARFGELYGIKVEVKAAEDLRVSDALADEAFHMVSEALSNIRRHTTASLARINLSCNVHVFVLQIANPCDSAASAKLFTPRSIAERALALGGTCQVETGPGRDTVVTVEIPLKSIGGFPCI
jgi:signal transduction histidine kinase